jgi:hypothetical protein
MPVEETCRDPVFGDGRRRKEGDMHMLARFRPLARLSKLPSPATPIAFVALVAAIGTGSAVALKGANTVDQGDLRAGSVGASEVKANAIGSSEAKANAIGSSEVRRDSLNGTDINESTLDISTPSAATLSFSADDANHQLFEIGGSRLVAGCGPADPGGPEAGGIRRRLGIIAGAQGAVIVGEGGGFSSFSVLAANDQEVLLFDEVPPGSVNPGFVSFAVFDGGGTAASGTAALLADPPNNRCVATAQAGG